VLARHDWRRDSFCGIVRHRLGIIDAFHGLATGGGATLQSVAPGIAEALLPPRRGCLPLFRGYSPTTSFSSAIKEFATQMDDFSLEFLNMTERYFTE